MGKLRDSLFLYLICSFSSFQYYDVHPIIIFVYVCGSMESLNGHGQSPDFLKDTGTVRPKFRPNPLNHLFCVDSQKTVFDLLVPLLSFRCRFNRVATVTDGTPSGRHLPGLAGPGPTVEPYTRLGRNTRLGTQTSCPRQTIHLCLP